MIRLSIIFYCIIWFSYGAMIQQLPSYRAILLVDKFSWGHKLAPFLMTFIQWSPMVMKRLSSLEITGREGWASWWEAEAETREGEFRAPDETYDLNSSLHASPNPDASALPTGAASTVPSPGSSCRAEADDALCRLPRVPDVAVHATFWSRHLEGQWSVPSCRLIAASDAGSVCELIGTWSP
jgi:hypothetical protein